MSKQSPAARAASSSNPSPVTPSDRLDAIGRYINLRDWSFALVDLMEVAGKLMVSGERIAVCDQTLMGASGLLRELLEQMDGRVGVIREG